MSPDNPLLLTLAWLLVAGCLCSGDYQLLETEQRTYLVGGFETQPNVFQYKVRTGSPRTPDLVCAEVVTTQPVSLQIWSYGQAKREFVGVAYGPVNDAGRICIGRWSPNLTRPMALGRRHVVIVDIDDGYVDSVFLVHGDRR